MLENFCNCVPKAKAQGSLVKQKDGVRVCLRGSNKVLLQCEVSLWLLSQAKLPLGAQPHRVIYHKPPSTHTARAKTKKSEPGPTQPSQGSHVIQGHWGSRNLIFITFKKTSYQCTVLVGEKQGESSRHHGAWAAWRGPRHDFLEVYSAHGCMSIDQERVRSSGHMSQLILTLSPEHRILS